MKHDDVYLAIDLGAGSGRVIAGVHDGRTLRLEEIHRFEHPPRELEGGLFWDEDRLWSEIRKGLAKASDRGMRDAVASIGVDTWGVDYGLVDRQGELLRAPFHYRDPRTEGLVEEIARLIPQDEIFETTGIQFMRINTLCQMFADVKSGGGALDRAWKFLMMPDLMNLRLCGRIVGERTIASTSQLYDPRSRQWATGLAARLGIRPDIFPELVDPGTVIGRLLPEVARAVGLPEVPVVAVASHDTASAVAAVPAEAPGFAFLSSGTWSLLGTELREPVLSPRCRSLNFTNEAGLGGTIRLLKNINGLWLVQECRRAWDEAGESISFDAMEAAAARADPLRTFIDPDAPEFTARCDMPAAVRAFAERTGQHVPDSQGGILRCIHDSLAMKYRFVLEGLESIVDRRLATLHVIGGGTRNEMLSQATADATRRTVVAGPVEATAAGNIAAQMIAAGAVASLDEARALVRRSFGTRRYEPDPRSSEAWDEAYPRFRGIVGTP